MSVTSDVQLPAQPTSGMTQEIPLGGNGWTAPHSATTCDINLASDASGGFNRLRIQMDPRYTSLISYAQVSVAAAAAAVANRITLATSDFDQITDASNTEFANVTGATIAAKLWKPPAVLSSSSEIVTTTFGYPHLLSYITNTNGETHFLRVRIYNFDKRARERTPLPVLLASLPR